MKIQILISFLVLSFLVSCNGQPAGTAATIKYMDSKSEFEYKLVNHFPSKNITLPYTTLNNKNVEKNEVGFMLYEYNVGSETKTTVSDFVKNNAIAHYTNKDQDLLIVNRFETLETYENRLDVVISDSTKIERSAYEKLFPIPNFINFEDPDYKKDIKLKGDFDIYVLEAKSGNYFKEFDLKPNAQMPLKWKNGYSKGIAIGRDKNTIIYWGIIW